MLCPLGAPLKLTRPALVLGFKRRRAFRDVAQGCAHVAVDLFVEREVLGEDLGDDLFELIVGAVDLFDVARVEQRLEDLRRDEVDAVVRQRELTDFGDALLDIA